MFRFIDVHGRQVWIKLATVILVAEDNHGDFTVQCVQSIWTMKKSDVMRLLAKLREKCEDNDDDPDWWKHGRPNPLDRESEDEDN